MLNRSALRKNSATDLLEKIKAASTKQTFNQEKDQRFWEPSVDDKGNGFAIVRFLPSKTEEGIPFVKVYSHGFKENSKWFIESCPTTIGEQCPVCDSNSEHWNSGIDSDKNISRRRKRKLRYISNVLVLKDPKNPDAEGKVFLYSYGQKIFDKLQGAMSPPEEYGEEPRDPYGFFDGCVTKLKIKQKDDFRNYDDTTVEPASDLFDGDEEKLEAILDAMYDINLVKSEKILAFDALKTKFDKFVGVNSNKETSGSTNAKEFGSSIPKRSEPDSSSEPQDNPSSDDPVVGDDDDDVAYFQKLANGE